MKEPKKHGKGAEAIVSKSKLVTLKTFKNPPVIKSKPVIFEKPKIVDAPKVLYDACSIF